MNLTTFETDIPAHYRHSDYHYVDFYYIVDVENGNHEMCDMSYHDNSQGYYAGDWKAVNCHHYVWGEPTDEELIYYMFDFENGELLVASQHYNVEEVRIEFDSERLGHKPDSVHFRRSTDSTDVGLDDVERSLGESWSKLPAS